MTENGAAAVVVVVVCSCSSKRWWWWKKEVTWCRQNASGKKVPAPADHGSRQTLSQEGGRIDRKRKEEMSVCKRVESRP